MVWGQSRQAPQHHKHVSKQNCFDPLQTGPGAWPARSEHGCACCPVGLPPSQTSLTPAQPLSWPLRPVRLTPSLGPGWTTPTYFPRLRSTLSYRVARVQRPPQVPKRRRDTPSHGSRRRLWGVASAAPICLPRPVCVHPRPTQQPLLTQGVREGTSSLWRDSASRELSYSRSHLPHTVPLFGGMLILTVFHVLK